MILASQSPRRIELMREAGFDIDVRPAHIDEAPLPNEDPFALVKRLARTKAAAVAVTAPVGEIVLAADTIVAIDGTLLGKPHDAEEAARMLRRLSGTTHTVATGVCLDEGRVDASGRTHSPKREPESFVTITAVTFYPLSDSEIASYVATGEPMDKAGAYGIQGAGGRLLVERIDGDFYNVVGLPIAEVVRHIRQRSTAI